VGLRSLLQQLLGVSAYQPPVPDASPSLDSKEIKQRRKRIGGGQLVPLPQTKTRFYQADLERAEFDADAGMLQGAGTLWRACKKDGTFMGVLSTRTGGLVRLPKKFQGRADIVAALEAGHESVRSVFDEMFPPAELEQIAADGIGLGVGVGEMLPVVGRDYPVLCRLDPQWLVYRWTEDRWYYMSVVGLIPITPGDGRWLLHIPGGRVAPWQNGIWRAIGRAFIAKEHSLMYDINWQSKLANPARVAIAPAGATEEQHQSWWRKVMAWGVNTVFGAKPGYDVKLLESNGIGYQSFDKGIARAEREMIIATAGQMVTTDGGTGFANADIHKSIRADLIKATADALAYTINTQGIPQWVVKRFGIEALDESAIVSWDVEPPKDLKSAADAMLGFANALKALTEAMAPYGGVTPDEVRKLAFRFGIAPSTESEPVPDAPSPAQPDERAANDNDYSEDVDFEEAA